MAFGLDSENISAAFFVNIDHLCKTGLAWGLHQNVRQEHGEGLVANDVPCAPDGMAQAQRRLLADEAGTSGIRQVLVEGLEFDR